MSQRTEPAWSRKEAKERGLKYYFTGKECSRGHLSARTASHAECIKCHAEDSAAFKRTTKGKAVAKRTSKTYYDKNAELLRAKHRVKYYQKQLDKALADVTDLTNQSKNN